MTNGAPINVLQTHCWDRLYAEVNAWRGECMHHIAVAEKAVTETLLALDAAKPEGAKVPLRHLIGQQLDDLANTINADGPFADVGKKAAKALEAWRNHESFRTFLCHGVAQVTMTRDSGWLLVIRNLSIRSRQAEEVTEIMDRKQAAAKLEQLKRDGQKLGACLGQLRKKVEAAQSS